MTKSQILDEIRRTARANGDVPLGWRTFSAETGIRESDWKGKLWARWGDAVREAGFTPNTLSQAYAETDLLERYAKLAHEIGHLPTKDDIRLAANRGQQIPEYKTFTRQFGGKAQLVRKLREYCKDRIDLAHVSRMCEAYMPRRSDVTGEVQKMDGRIGYVYLIKSGRFYKIGFSNASGRRHYELSIQLPERATLVHEIKTDDPAGIEAYWHKRFQDKRKNGEWFELTKADITAFKRRKFM